MSLHATTELRTATCSIRIERPAPRTIIISIEGHDVGELGALPMRCAEALMPADGAVALDIDARSARGATMDVSREWARWLEHNRARFSSVRMRVASPYVRVTADFVRRFSGIESLMTIEATHGAPRAAG